MCERSEYKATFSTIMLALFNSSFCGYFGGITANDTLKTKTPSKGGKLQVNICFCAGYID